MLSSLTIQGFRGFDRLTVGKLARTNLIVGKNNSGKSSILEAVSLLVSNGDPLAIYPFMSRRGEIIDTAATRAGRSIDVRRLFLGHNLRPGIKFEIRAPLNDEEIWVRYSIIEAGRLGAQASLFDTVEEEEELESGVSRATSMALFMEGSNLPPLPPVLLTQDGGVRTRDLERSPVAQLDNEPRNLQFVSADSWSGGQIASHWAKIALTPEQELVESALRLLDPDVEQIAFVGSDATVRSFRRNAVLVRRRGEALPVPIGSMGDGMWRMLVLAIALVRSERGTLLVDEIDTGLHHTVMSSMWKMVETTAARLSVQVIATTHSLDCVRSLASICRSEGSDQDSRVAMHRVEQGMGESVHYSERQIVIAAERGIETR